MFLRILNELSYLDGSHNLHPSKSVGNILDHPIPETI